MKNLLIFLFALVLSFSIIGTVNATLIKEDFVPNSGDNWLTLDTETNLEWLNPMVTYMTDAIKIQFQNYGNWYGNGFKAAKYEQVDNLMKGYLGSNESDWTVQKAWEFIGIMGGPIYHNPNPSFSQEYYLIGPTEIFYYDGDAAQALRAGLSVDFERNKVFNSGSGIYSGNPLTNDMSGNWLVRQAAVPEPATMLLLGSGLLGLWGFRKKFRK